MMHKHCFEALDQSLKDILNLAKPFGGKTVVFGGDFRQILPMVPKGSREQIVQASQAYPLVHLSSGTSISASPLFG